MLSGETGYEKDLESQKVGFNYQWSDEEDSADEKSQLLREFRKQNSGKTKRPKVNVRDQPEFHEGTRSFAEIYLDCCIPRTSSHILKAYEVSEDDTLTLFTDPPFLRLPV